MLLGQNINLFDTKDPFFNDICFHFDSINGKDVPLNVRIKEFYPNINLCDEGCENTDINYTSKSAICECTPKDTVLSEIIDNPVMSMADFSII